MLLTLEQAWAPVVAALGGPILVAAGGLVVVLAILLVFLMVLRSNGDARKMSNGIGYDAQQGPPGQPRAPSSQPQRQNWGAEGEYGAPMGSANGAQAGWGAQPANGQWQGQDQAGWGSPAPAPGSAPAWGGAPASQWQGQDQGGWGSPAQPGQQPSWGAPAASQSQQPSWGAPAPQQQGGWGAPASAPASGGWGAPAATANGQDWGAAQVAPGGMSMGQPGFGQSAGAPAMGYGGQPAQRMGVLIVRQGKEPGRTFEMRKDRTTIGRSRESDIFLEDLAVSRLHTTIGRDEHGRYIVHDENSANGTFVNGQRIAEHVLEEGDEVQVGQTILAFVWR